MSKDKFNLHELKRARLKTGLLEAALSSLEDRLLDQVNVEEVCRQVETSRVTFFKYFPVKGDILNYFIQVWNFRVNVSLHDRPLRGFEGVTFLFERVLDWRQHKNIMLALVGHMSSLTEAPKLHKITAAERHVLFPERDDLYDLEVTDFPALLASFIDEARAEKRLPASLDTPLAAAMFSTVFYGAAVPAHISGADSLEPIYRGFLKMFDVRGKEK